MITDPGISDSGFVGQLRSCGHTHKTSWYTEDGSLGPFPLSRDLTIDHTLVN